MSSPRYSSPRRLDVVTSGAQLEALVWGPPDGPVALCLHGFPDTAHGWRRVAPLLADAGWRVVAPFQRGYAPSSLPTDGSHHIGALMHDALRVLDAAGSTGRDVVIGHDWGAMTVAGLAAMPDNVFRRAVILSVPPFAAFRPLARAPEPGRLAAGLPRQLRNSWYIFYSLLPFLPERSASWLVPRLWRQWSPGYPAEDDLRHVADAIGTPDRWRSAISFYRTTFTNRRPPPKYSELQRHWLSPPLLPTLYLHGVDDGCCRVEYLDWVAEILPANSRTAVVEEAGHFLALEQPDVVARHILDFVGTAD